MPDETLDFGSGIPDTEAWQQRVERLEREVARVRQQAEAKLIMAELKTEAIRAGMVDLDGLRLIDISTLSINEDYTVPGALAAIENFKRTKPWLFTGTSSSNPTAAPPAQPTRTKSALDMTDAEYTAARAVLLRQGNH